jgi:hypothetical protein
MRVLLISAFLSLMSGSAHADWILHARIYCSNSAAYDRIIATVSVAGTHAALEQLTREVTCERRGVTIAATVIGWGSEGVAATLVLHRMLYIPLLILPHTPQTRGTFL